MIFYFSATGNNKYIAEQIAQEFDSKIFSIQDCLENNELEFALDKDEFFRCCNTNILPRPSDYSR